MTLIKRLGLLALSLTILGRASAEPLTWYVSPQGNDAWTGTMAEPNADKTDGPFATLAAARDASRKDSGKARKIILSEGRFYLTETLVLDARDSLLTVEGTGQGKTFVHGGRRLTGWAKAGDDLWAAPLPADAPDWSFRLLVVDDKVCDRARYPETGYLEHETKFPVRWMSTAGGGWERKPTMEEYTTMVYKAGDVPADLRIENAEVTICHMWDESTLSVAKHDPATRTITFADRGSHPPGAFNVHRYAIWNTREGMTRPGQWYLDKVERKVYYWPQEGQNMADATVVAPLIVKIISVTGDKKARGKDISIRNMTVSVGDASKKRAGFGGSQWPGAINTDGAQDTRIENVEVTNVGGWGVRGGTQKVVNCHLHHLGGGGVKSWGGGLVEGNHIHNIGLVSANCIGIMGGGKNSVVRRNVIHDTPYSGMCVGGTNTLIEENELFRCMQVHHDGAAIYMGGGKDCIIRRNLARDMVEIGKGYGVSAYYLDEKCQGCIVAENIAIDIPHPSQNHMTLNCELRDNVFICKGDMKIAFSRCSGHKITGNKFHLEGKLNVREPDAITEWKDNLIFTRNDVGGTVMDSVPRKPQVPREKPRYYKPKTIDKPPVVDGKMGPDEWPSGGISLGERTTQRSARGAPTSVKILTDAANIHILVNIVSMFPEQRKLGTEWGKDEGVELAIEVGTGDKKTTYVLRGFTDGTLLTSDVAGATPAASAEFAKAISYGAGVEKKLWHSEWTIPFSALGIKPGQKALVPMSLTGYRSEDDLYAQHAGTLGETWNLEHAIRLMVNWDSGGSVGPTVSVPSLATLPAGDDWSGKVLELAQTSSGVPLPATPGSATVARAGDVLLVRVCVPTKSLKKGSDWGKNDGAEVCIRGKAAGKSATWIVQGFADGSHKLSDEAGAPAAACTAMQPKVQFSATTSADKWCGEWHLPLADMGVDTGKPIPFNIGAFRTEDRRWISWIGTGGPNWKLDRSGSLKLP